MAMGKKKRKSKQTNMWVPTQHLPRSASHPFYQRLNQVLDEAGFDEFVEQRCACFYAPKMGRPSLAPGRYFRKLLSWSWFLPSQQKTKLTPSFFLHKQSYITVAWPASKPRRA